MKPPIAIKRLAPVQLASVLALQASAVHQDADIMTVVAAMVQLGARATTIVRLTGLAGAVVRRLCQRERPMEHPGTGRVPTSISRVFITRQIHLEASIFLRFFSALHVYVGALDARILVEAVRLYQETIPGDPQLRFEMAVYVAEQYLAKAISLSRCDTCTTLYLRSAQRFKIQERRPEHGRCPTCRRHRRT